MSTTTSPASENGLSVKGSNFLGREQASGPVSHPQETAAESYDMCPRTRQVVYLSLLAGVLFLGSVAAYVWYGLYQWQNIR